MLRILGRMCLRVSARRTSPDISLRGPSCVIYPQINGRAPYAAIRAFAWDMFCTRIRLRSSQDFTATLAFHRLSSASAQPQFAS